MAAKLYQQPMEGFNLEVPAPKLSVFTIDWQEKKQVTVIISAMARLSRNKTKKN